VLNVGAQHLQCPGVMLDKIYLSGTVAEGLQADTARAGKQVYEHSIHYDATQYIK
jgi:hypothetical protein